MDLLTTAQDVDDYLGELFPDDNALTRALTTAAEAGVPAIHVSPMQGRFLQLLARLVQARRVLEVGTLVGYSTIWLARGVAPGGRVVTLEIDPDRAALARDNLRHAGVDDRVEIIVGAARDTLPTLEPVPPFDLVFIDADKPGNAAYVEHALRLSRPGGVIVVDNVVRRGEVLDADGDDNARGSREALSLLSNHPGVDATVLQTVGAKGYDGFALGVIR